MEIKTRKPEKTLHEEKRKEIETTNTLNQEKQKRNWNNKYVV